MPTSALVCRQKSAGRADVGIGPYGRLNRYLQARKRPYCNGVSVAQQGHFFKTAFFKLPGCVCVKCLLAGFLSAKGKRYRWSCQGEEMETGAAKLSAGLRACCAVVSFRNCCRKPGACYDTAHANRCLHSWTRRRCGSSRNRVPRVRAPHWRDHPKYFVNRQPGVE